MDGEGGILMGTVFTIMKKTELRFRGFFAFYLIASIIVAVAMVLTNLFEGGMAEAALLGDLSVLVHFLFLITGLVVIRAIFSGLSVLFLGRLSAKADYNLRTHFIDHFLRAPFGKVEATGSGEILSVYSNDISSAAVLVTQNIANIIEGFAMFVVSGAFLLMTSPFYTGILIVAFVVMMLLVVLIIQPMNYFQKKASEETAKFNAVVNDSLQNLSVVAAYSLDEVVEERYMSAYGKYMAIIKKVALAAIGMVAITFLALFGPMAIINVIMAFSVIDGTMSIPEFIAYMGTIMMVVGGLSNVANSVGATASTIARAKRVIENTDSAPEEMKDGETLDTTAPMDITFENVSFTYGIVESEEPVEDENEAAKKKKSGIKISFGAPPANEVIDEKEIDTEESSAEIKFALENVSFNIKAGSKVAFVGGSGSGK